MFAILETGGKQYKVEEGDILEVERLDEKRITKQKKINFDTVLLIKDEETQIGQPYLKNAKIKATLLEEFKAPKVIIFKKKAKKQYKRKTGHRQQLHRIKIEKIEVASKPKEKEND